MTTEDQYQMTPAAKYDNLLMRLASEATSGLPVSIPVEDLNRAWDRIRVAFKDAAMRDATIYNCAPASVAAAVVRSALTNLYPGGPLPDVYLLARNNSFKRANGSWGKRLELQWEISYRGLAKLARRSGCIIEPVAVMEGDAFAWKRGLNPDLTHVPTTDAPTWDRLTHVYIVVTDLTTRMKRFEVLAKPDIEKRREVSQSWRAHISKGRSSPWADWPVEMALKTGVRYAMARGLVVLDEPSLLMFQMDGVDHAIPVDAAPELTGPVHGRPALPDRTGLDGLAGLLDPDAETADGSPPPADTDDEEPPSDDGGAS